MNFSQYTSYSLDVKLQIILDNTSKKCSEASNSFYICNNYKKQFLI